MYTSSIFVFALAAATSVFGGPAPIIKRAPEPKIFYAKDIAHPTSSPNNEKRSISECQAVNEVVSALKAVSRAAYPFCSSFIHIPVVTSTIAFTTTVTPSPVSITATVTPAASTIITTTVTTSTVTDSTSTIYSHYTPSAAKEKRANPTLPPYVVAFGEAQVSKACSCLSIPASTTTVTTTVGTTLSASTITATATAATPTVTLTSTTTTAIAGSTTTIPALCAPSALLVTSNVLSTAGNDDINLISKASITDISSCCAACLGTTNCLSYFLDSGSCAIFVAVDPSTPNTGNAAQNAICPLGANSQDTLFPPGLLQPGSGDSAFHVGPCLSDATALI